MYKNYDVPDYAALSSHISFSLFLRSKYSSQGFYCMYVSSRGKDLQRIIFFVQFN